MGWELKGGKDDTFEVDWRKVIIINVLENEGIKGR